MQLKSLAQVIAFLLCCIVSSSAQDSITFEKTYGEGGWSYGGTSVRQTSDHGYILFGVATNLTDYKYSWLLIKTDSVGNVEWKKRYGNEYSFESQNTVQQTSDGGYILCGSLGGPFEDSLVLIKTDPLGNQIWFNAYPVSSERSVGRSVEETMDGGFIIAGYAGRIMKEDVYVIKTDDLGVVEWSKTYGGFALDRGYCVKQTQEGNYFVLGETISYGQGGYDMYVLKLNSTGDTIWTKTYGTSSNYEGGYSLDLTSDGGIICLGVGDDLSREMYAVKIDADGNEMWNKLYGNAGWDFGNSVHQTADGGYFMAGIFTLSTAVGSEMHCIKTNASGDILWEKGFRKGKFNEAVSAQQTLDGGYIILGGTVYVGDSINTGYMYLVKTDSAGNTTGSIVPPQNVSITICPNPFFETAYIKFDQPLGVLYTLNLYDALGREIREESGELYQEIEIKRDDLSAGMYFFKILSGGKEIGKGRIIAL